MPAPELDMAGVFQELPTRTLQLKQYDAGPFARYDGDHKPTTPSEWFGKLFPEQSRVFGCPFIELKEQSAEGFTKNQPARPKYRLSGFNTGRR